MKPYRILLNLFAIFYLCAVAKLAASEALNVKSITRPWQQQHGLTVLNDFRELLSIPNVASDSLNINKNADWIENYLQARKFTTQRLSAGGAPYLYAELISTQATKTILLYAHFDGQPVQAEHWVTPAWQPQLRDSMIESGGKPVTWPSSNQNIDENWRIFARSAGDDKAPVIALMAAIDALASVGKAPAVNIKLILDGEEEAGSPTLAKIVDQLGDSLKADLMLFCDGPMHQSGKRQLVFGVRGVHALNLTTYGAIRPLHSGHYGNWAPGAAEEMVTLLASLHDSQGRIAIKDFYNDVLPITAAEQQAINKMPNIEQQLKNSLAVHTPRSDGHRIEESIMWPAAVITGIQVGSTGEKARNVLVPRASASINFRLVADQSPARVEQLVETHFKSQGYFVTDQLATPEILRAHAKVITLQWPEAGYPAFRTSLQSSAAKQLNRLLTRLDGEAPLMTPTMGGSLPIYLFEKVVGGPIIILPIANYDNNQHGSNENLKVSNLWQAIDVYAAVLSEYQ